MRHEFAAKKENYVWELVYYACTPSSLQSQSHITTGGTAGCHMVVPRVCVSLALPRVLDGIRESVIEH